MSTCPILQAGDGAPILLYCRTSTLAAGESNYTSSILIGMNFDHSMTTTLRLAPECLPVLDKYIDHIKSFLASTGPASRLNHLEPLFSAAAVRCLRDGPSHSELPPVRTLVRGYLACVATFNRARANNGKAIVLPIAEVHFFPPHEVGVAHDYPGELYEADCLDFIGVSPSEFNAGLEWPEPVDGQGWTALALARAERALKLSWRCRDLCAFLRELFRKELDTDYAQSLSDTIALRVAAAELDYLRLALLSPESQKVKQEVHRRVFEKEHLLRYVRSKKYPAGMSEADAMEQLQAELTSAAGK